MKRTVLALAVTLVAATAGAHAPPDGKPLDPETEKLVREALPVCADMNLSTTDFPQSMPQGFSARVIHASSESHSCDGSYLLVTSASGTSYLGTPWFLEQTGGKTIEERLKDFAWKNIQANITPVIERKRSQEGLFPVTLQQVTERGKVPMEGLVDADGRVFFLGRFSARSASATEARLASLQPLVAKAPSRGAAKPAVTIVEFSDFQCPSCKRSSGFAEAIVARHPDAVRYVRFDLPLIQSHPWAFGAAAAGRAIYRQKPELFWEYKKHVYESQDRLNAFVFDDFARGFADDRDLDMAKYDADLASEELRNEILKGVGAAFSNHVRATPTFMVNGTFIASGPEGKELADYVEQLLKN
ncbi:MAG TPA: thioredoxin domain-containing protein [Thermoanaerobaculia bacterium]|nr:thioredoxin domain-containing protein [Thermoanaerobaculia bacterium]